MENKLTAIAAPEWMLRLFQSIDELDFSEGSGFQIFAEDVVMQFGTETVKGLEAVKQFFVTLDAPFITEHRVDTVFQYDRAFVMQGSATLRKKNDPVGRTFEAAPLFNLLWFDDKGKVIRYVVDFPPDAAETSGLMH